jgi:hypothetical protein
MAKSDKIIATTTSLIDPNNIKQIEYIIDTYGQIQNIKNIKTKLNSNKTNRQIQIDGM